ncbi:BatA domain-containing protein [Crocinitomicaceae bacterium]|nr:BatA domain-containing protein [Crocinitomicaceae bacterium]
MKFLYPEFLWALTVLAIPIVIHLFNFKRYKTLYFSSLNFIKHVDQQTKSTQRLKHWLILASRLLAFLFLVFAFAQPYFSTTEDKVNSKSPIYTFYLDNSFSMQARGPEGELLSEAREKAKEIVEKSPADARFIIGTNEMSGREERILNRREAMEKLDAIELSPLTRTLEQTTQWQQEVLNKLLDEESKTRVNSFIFSDFQKDKSGVLPKADENITYYPTRLVPEKTTNVYVDSAWFSSPTHKVNQSNTLNIKIQNDTEADIENLETTIQLKGLDKTIFVNVPAGKSTITSFTHTDKESGWNEGRINVADQSVFFDDSYYISYEVQKFTNILVINGEDAVRGAHVIYEINDAYRCVTKEITSVTKDDFDQKDLVVINGANQLPSGIISFLEAFRETGGSISLFPGRNPNRGNWNQLLQKNKLPSLGNAVSSGTRIKTVADSDPFYNGVFDEKTSDINLPGVSKAFQAIKNNSRASDLITMQNGLPLLSYTKGNGYAFMFYSSAHEDFGSITDDVLFTTILLRMGELSKRNQPIALTIGNATKYPVYKEIKGDEVFHITGNNIDVIPQHEEISGVHYLSLSKLDNFTQLLAGNYSIKTKSPVGKLSLNFNRAESKLKYYEQSDVERIFGENQYQYNEISSTSELSTNDINKPFSYWKICIILTIIFVASEMLLVRILK